MPDKASRKPTSVSMRYVLAAWPRGRIKISPEGEYVTLIDIKANDRL